MDMPTPDGDTPQELAPDMQADDDVTADGDAEAGSAIAPITDETRRAVEAIILVSEYPVPAELLAQLCEVSIAQIDQICAELSDFYAETERGFILAQVAGGYRFQSHVDQAPYVERYVLEGQSSRLSAAALETLAIIAYKQPISRAQVAAIRGVGVDAVIRTLDQRKYIAEIARDPGPGQAALFGTTSLFLDKMGLASLADLPPLRDFMPGAEVVEALEHGLRVSDTDVTDTELVDTELADTELADTDVVDTGGEPIGEPETTPGRHPGQPDGIVIDLTGRRVDPAGQASTVVPDEPVAAAAGDEATDD